MLNRKFNYTNVFVLHDQYGYVPKIVGTIHIKFSTLETIISRIEISILRRVQQLFLI